MGIMGSGMAANLLKGGHDVVVWNRTVSRTEPLAELGATVGENPADVAAQSDIIFTCVGGTADVEAVILGENGIIHGISADNLVVDHSTISPQATREMGAALAEKGAHMLDAPISGGSEGAKNGTLSIMVGGTAEQFKRAHPYMALMGKTVTHVGDLGAGQTVKLVNQILVVNTMQGIAEALTFAKAGGLDLEKTLAAVSGGAAASWALTNRALQIVDDYWEPGFTIDWQTKDLRLVAEAAGQLDLTLPATEMILGYYEHLQSEGRGSEGNHALIKANDQW